MKPWFSFIWDWSRRKPDIEFTSPLTIKQCQKQLREAVAYTWRLNGPSASHGFIGRVWETGFYLTNMRASFLQPGGWLFLYGGFMSRRQGTGVHAAFQINLVWWLSFPVALLGLIALALEDVLLARNSAWFWLLIGVVVIILAVTTWHYAWSHKPSQNEMLAYLRQTLGTAEPI